eukprot:11209639-Lingulodinium_polyedra.AAC.1
MAREALRLLLTAHAAVIASPSTTTCLPMFRSDSSACLYPKRAERASRIGMGSDTASDESRRPSKACRSTRVGPPGTS